MIDEENSDNLHLRERESEKMFTAWGNEFAQENERKISSKWAAIQSSSPHDIRKRIHILSSQHKDIQMFKFEWVNKCQRFPVVIKNLLLSVWPWFTLDCQVRHTYAMSRRRLKQKLLFISINWYRTEDNKMFLFDHYYFFFYRLFDLVRNRERDRA